MQLTFPIALTPATPRSRLSLLPWIASLLIVLVVSTALRAEIYTIPGTNITLTYSLSGDPATATITACDRTAAGALAIPGTLGGSPVTAIGDYTFISCNSLTSVTIPNSVTSISDSAFDYCSSLTAFIVNPANNTFSSLDGVLFNKAKSVLIQYPSAKNLSTYTIPNSVTSIGNGAFSYCMSLPSVTIPNSVTSIGNGAFSGCTSLTSVTIPNSVTTIGSSAFHSCSSLKSVTIPNSVTTIGDAAFSHCSSLTTFIVGIANSVYSSLDGVLINKAQSVLVQYPSANTRSNFTIPDNVTTIGAYAFEYCFNLTSVNLGNNITTISTSAFDYCSSLNSVNLGNSITAIGSYAFSGCSSLKSVTIPNSVTSINEGAFSHCTSLNSVSIPNSVTSIGNGAFHDCTSLTSVIIPNSVTSIGVDGFSNCTSLTSVTFASNAPTWPFNRVFNKVAPSFTIYYPPWASGFTTPTWQGYPAQPTLFYADTTHAVGGGWKWNGLGFIYDGFYPFLWLPQQQKWLYLVGSDEDSFYFFDFTRSYWGWTARSYYPLGVMLDGPENGAWVEL